MGYNVILKNSEQTLHLKSELPGPGEDDFNVSLLWLRENCRCPDCYSELTHQRKFLATDLNLNITARYVTLLGDVLTVLWDNDPQVQIQPDRAGPGEPPFLWTGASVDGLLTRLTAADVLLESGTRKLLSDIFTYGVGVVDKVDPTIEATRTLVTSVCTHIRSTLFGSDIYTLSADLSYEDTAYTNQELGLHTDNTYFIYPTGVQIFHCLQPAEQGGDTLLVDAFHAASLLRSQNKQAYDTLTRMSVEFEYRDSSHYYAARHRVLEQDEVTRQLKAVRFNLYDRSPRVQFPSSPRDVKLFYSSLQQFTRLLHSPDLCYSLKLTPGRVLFVNNWRVLHGRSSYRGQRSLAGCYVTMGNLMSRARMLKLI
ncbi:hypothetical protein WDU94_003195 [Cyamophila willieti]